MIDNVAHGVQGAAFYTEVGDEIGSMVGNIAIRTVNPAFTLDDEGAIDPDLRADLMDFGVDGDGFWLSGHMVSMRDNVSAGASAHGIIIWSDGVIEPDLARGRSSVLVANVENVHLITGRETIPTWWAPLAEISNNESYGATVGFRSRYVHSSGYLGEIGSAFHAPPDQAYIDTLNPTIDGLTVWGSRDGVLMNYNERMSIKNTRLVGTGARYVQNGGTADIGVGIDLYNEVTRGPGVIENVSIEGYNMGMLAPRQDAWHLNNVQLSNTTDMLITEARQAPRALQMTNVTFGSLDGTAVADQASQRQNIVMSPDFDADAHQPFFFLMQDQITFDGQQIYFDQQASDFIPIQRQIDFEAVRLPSELLGATNQQLNDRHGTSFGGAITPADAQSVDFVAGGVVGSLAQPASATPPMYDVRSEGAAGVLVDPGTLTNFSGPVTDPGDVDPDADPEPDGEDDDEPGEEEPGEEEPGEEEPGEEDEGEEDEDSEDDVEADGGDELDDDEGDDASDLDDEDAEDPDEESNPDEEDDADEDVDEEGDSEETDAEDVDEEDSDDSGGDVPGEEDESEDAESDEDDFDDHELDSEEGSDPDGDDGELEEDEEETEAVDAHNDAFPTDVNNDGATSALDALVILNYLNRFGTDFLATLTAALEHYIDVNNDGNVSAVDALCIINSIAGGTHSVAQAESVDRVFHAHDPSEDDDEEDDLWLVLSQDLR